MSRLLRALPLLILAACAGAPSEPVAARLSAQGLRVTMSNGQVCRGGPPPAGVRRWAGDLGGCPEGWRYVVLLDRRTNPARFLVETILTALDLDRALAPVAEVQVTDPSGLTTVFASPPR